VDKPDDELEYIKNYMADLKRERDGDAAQPDADDDDDEEEAPQPRGRSRRAAISASVMTEDDVQDYERKVIPKDAPTMLRLQRAVSDNVLFQHLDTEELAEVLDAMFLVKHPPNTTIITQGDEGDNFYVVDEGQVEVWKTEEGEDEAKMVLELGPGGSFGELALIYNQPRAASIKSKTDVQLWALDQDTYRRILMGSTIRKRKMYEAFLEKVTILADVDKYERLQVADALVPCTFEDGSNVVSQGDAGNEFFMIVEGKAVVTQTNDKGESGQVNELGPGDYFGEVALLKDNKRIATVSASGELKCVKLDRDTFERVLGPIEDILRRNMENYVKFTGSDE
jgi:cAMP-dependent protein kinase regulator